jgi:hypothetical protein
MVDDSNTGFTACHVEELKSIHNIMIFSKGICLLSCCAVSLKERKVLNIKNHSISSKIPPFDEFFKKKRGSYCPVPKFPTEKKTLFYCKSKKIFAFSEKQGRGSFYSICCDAKKNKNVFFYFYLLAQDFYNVPLKEVLLSAMLLS